MAYYRIVTRKLFKFLPETINTESYIVFNDYSALETTLSRFENTPLVIPVRIEECKFKNGVLVRSKILRDLEKEDAED